MSTASFTDNKKIKMFFPRRFYCCDKFVPALVVLYKILFSNIGYPDIPKELCYPFEPYMTISRTLELLPCIPSKNPERRVINPPNLRQFQLAINISQMKGEVNEET